MYIHLLLQPVKRLCGFAEVIPKKTHIKFAVLASFACPTSAYFVHRNYDIAFQ